MVIALRQRHQRARRNPRRRVGLICSWRSGQKHGHFGQSTGRSAVGQASRWREVASAAS